jgi:hypothetical protein
MVARDVFFWAWPMVNVYNRRLAFKEVPEPGLMGGIVPVAPVNRLFMLTDYIEPEERLVACLPSHGGIGRATRALAARAHAEPGGLTGRHTIAATPGRRTEGSPR